jgi:predicted helicase
MFDRYLAELNRLYRSGQATEHSYRPALQECLTSLLKDVQVTNEPKRQKCGAPDYILTRRKIDIGYIEAKDISVDLDRVERGSKNDDQWYRYATSLDNIILTDYVEFRFFRNGEKVESIRIANVAKDFLTPIPENFDRLQTLLLDFVAFEGRPIKSAKKLAEMMAHKAALMRDVFFNAVSDESAGETTLRDQLDAFKAVLVHDMDEAQFADVYAQTIAYGLFTARLHDTTLKDFTRGEAITLIPKSNPFLRQLFQYVAGSDLDQRVVWIVDALCEVFRHADLNAVLKDFGTATGKADPILHFYETFLAEYDPKLRKARGVWYTPEPVVRFIVRAVDDVLKTHFGIKDGIADTSKIKIKVDGHDWGKSVKIKEEVHRVQLLDVATGTGTFLAEVVKQIYSRFAGQEGLWSDYVDNHLLPRMHGFELLMASYAMCHMKLDLLLQQTGYTPTGAQKRLSVYLTNSLEEHHKDSHLPFANWLSREANEASRIKREMPIMVALGNPPYSGHSSNNGEWIKGLLDAYKKEPGGKIRLQEKNGKWLNDDYVKFIRLGEHYIAKNGEGILAYITNHSYLDNPTFRGMRWHLLNTFDDIYILDLHGSAKKKEIAPDGSADKNVFDIQQGVAIIVAVKKTTQKPKFKSMAKVHFKDLQGSREYKYNLLDCQNIDKIQFAPIMMKDPDFLFIPRDNTFLAEYKAGFPLNILFTVNSVGIVTARDDLTINSSKEVLIATIRRFAYLPTEEARKEFSLGNDARDWKVELAQNELKNTALNMDNVKSISYRPFDNRWTYFTGKSKGFHCMPRGDVMRHFLAGENVGLVIGRQGQVVGSMEWGLVFCSSTLPDFNIFYRGGGLALPLWVYESIFDGIEKKRPNLDPKIYKDIQNIVPDVQPQSLFDYIYAVLHSRAYRQRYAEFLKSDFPRIPHPKDPKTFHALAAKGAELRGLHLMESPVLDALITTYPIGGDHKVVTPRWEEAKDNLAFGRVWINPTQYFDKVPLTAWEFYIGGYQPAQKWLKDRRGRTLTSDDLRHWQRIIIALTETDKIMSDIERIDFLP